MQEPEKSVDNVETQPMDTMPADSQIEPTSPVHPMQPLTPHATLSRASTKLDVNEHGLEAFDENGLENPPEEECPTGDECVDVCPENQDEVLVLDSDAECAMSPPKKTENKSGDGTHDGTVDTRTDPKQPETKSSPPAQEVPEDSQPDPDTRPDLTTETYALEEEMGSGNEKDTKDAKGTFQGQLALRRLAKEQKCEAEDPDKLYKDELSDEEGCKKPKGRGRGRGGRGRGRSRAKAKATAGKLTTPPEETHVDKADSKLDTDESKENEAQQKQNTNDTEHPAAKVPKKEKKKLKRSATPTGASSPRDLRRTKSKRLNLLRSVSKSPVKRKPEVQVVEHGDDSQQLLVKQNRHKLVQSRSTSAAFYIPNVKDETLKKIKEVTKQELKAPHYS
eukprot:s1546_g14.t1